MISVIVPVYNMERYLKRCIDSILAQTCGEFELLLIDDGSADSSGSICDSYEKQDERIRVFHKENGGLSDARNYGLDRARGNFITFVDSDDYIGQDYLRILLEMVQENDADISILSYEMTASSETVFVESVDQRTVLSNRDAFRELLQETLFNCFACCKLLKTELFDQVRFPVGKAFEDMATIPYLVSACRCCVYSTAKQYYYYQRADSISHCISERAEHDWFDETERLVRFTAEHYPELSLFAASRLVRGITGDIIDGHLFRGDYLTIATQYREKYKNLFRQALSLPGMMRNQRVKAILFLFSVRLYREIRVVWIGHSKKQYSTHVFVESKEKGSGKKERCILRTRT